MSPFNSQYLTQGSGLRPQPWAVESQLLQSCQGCVPFSDVYGQTYLGGNWLTFVDGMYPMVEWCLPIVYGYAPTATL